MESKQEQIARRAYELFQARGGQHGYHMSDWLQAEKEILKKTAAPAAAAAVAPKKTVKAPEVSKATTDMFARKKTGIKKPY
jgi:hypothetical protein